MAVGKSAVGRHLARRLKRRFVDLDRVIEKSAGSKVRQTLTVHLGDRAYPIFVGAGLLSQAGEFLNRAGLRGKVAVLSNPTVAQLYLDTTCEALTDAAFQAVPVLVPDGEEHKNLQTL